MYIIHTSKAYKVSGAPSLIIIAAHLCTKCSLNLYHTLGAVLGAEKLIINKARTGPYP